MKKILLFLALVSFPALAELSQGEYFSTGDARISQAVNKTQAQVAFTYSVAKNGGSKTAHNTGVSLPAKAIITRSYFQVGQVFASASSAGTVAISCETANNIKTATDITGSSVGDFVDGQSTGAIAGFKAITNGCDINVTVATWALTAGKLKGWVEYVIGQ